VIEEGFTNTPISKATVERYLEEKAFEDIDGIILACTHYPLLKNDIAYFYRNRIQIFDSTDFVANAVKESLARQKLLHHAPTATHHFYVSDYTEVFEKTTRIFYGENIRLEKFDLWS
jgi:glutamate racemase